MSPPRSTRRRARRQATRARGVPFSCVCLHLPYAGPNALLAAGFPDVDRTIEGGVVHRVAGTYPIQTAAEIFGRLLEDVGLLPVDAAVEDADVDVEASAALERRAGVADPRLPLGERGGVELHPQVVGRNEADDVVPDEAHGAAPAQHLDQRARIGARAAGDDGSPDAADARPGAVADDEELARLIVRLDRRAQVQPIGERDVAGRGQLLAEDPARRRLRRIRRVRAHRAAHLEVDVAQRVRSGDGSVELASGILRARDRGHAEEERDDRERRDRAPHAGMRLPNSARALARLRAASDVRSLPRSRAARATVAATNAGSFRLPRCGAGARYGASVSNSTRSSGTRRAASRRWPFVANVSVPAKER